MVNVVASRIAGLRLLAIICVLLIPIVFLSSLMLKKLRSEISFADAELTGVSVADAVAPILIGLSAGTLKPEGGIKLLEGVAKQSAVIGTTEELSTLSALLANKKITRRDQIEETAHVLHEIGLRSNLVLDPFAESFFLAMTNIINLPGLVSDFYKFQSSLDAGINSNGLDHNEFRQLLLLIGNLSEALDRSQDSLSHATQESMKPEIYEVASALIEDMKREVEVTIEVISDAKPGTEALVLTMLAKQTIKPSSKYSMANEVWTDTSGRLKEILSQRIADYWTRLYLMFGVSGLCVLLAGGFAYFMFRSTLRRLDMVEAEKVRADGAREEAEAMSARITSINEDVTSLNRDLAEKVLRLKQAQDELVQKGRMEQLGQLTATIAHEIRNPLGSVRTSAFVLEKKTLGKGLGLESQIDRINRGVTRCDNIITQLLDFSRTKQLSCQSAQLDDWIVRVVEEEAAKLPLAVSIECALGLGVREVPFDPGRLQRALINLLNNASEAMVGTGEDPSKFHSPTPRIVVSTSAEDGFAVISVRDNGPGISAENLEKVRQPLFTTKSFGTGLGVPAIEKILEQHGGHLDVRSVEGKGAEFRAYLPLVGKAQAAEAA